MTLGDRLKIEGVRFSPHTLRHTFAGSYLRKAGNLFYLSRILGHTSVKTIEQLLAKPGCGGLTESALWVTIVIEMSHSPQERLANMDVALMAFIGRVQGHCFSSYSVHTIAPEFVDVFSTTWIELYNNGYLEHTSSRGYYRLTCHGWVEAIKLSGYWDSRELNVTLSLLCKNLKDRIKGRTDSVTVHIDIVATEIGVPVELLHNIIDADLFDRKLCRSGAAWASMMPKGDINVPITFGLKNFQF